MRKSQVKSKRLAVKLHSEEHEAIKTAARKAKMTMSEYVRKLAKTGQAPFGEGEARKVQVEPPEESPLNGGTTLDEDLDENPMTRTSYVDDLGPDTLRRDNQALTR